MDYNLNYHEQSYIQAFLSESIENKIDFMLKV